MPGLRNALTWSATMDARYERKTVGLLSLAVAATGTIFGDLGTSPLYVLNGIFPAAGDAPSAEDVLGAVSAIVWSITLVPLIKYIIIALEFGTKDEQAEDVNKAPQEGGPFALYGQLYLSEPKGSEITMPTIHTPSSSRFNESKRFIDRAFARTTILVIALVAVGLIMSDGILTPAVSVVSAVGGLAVAVPSLNSSDIVGISIAILVVLFGAQRYGTARLGSLFGPIVLVWFALLAGTGIANIATHPGIFRAFDPSRAVLYFVRQGSITPLSGVLLAITGCEASYANLGQFSKGSIRLSFIACVYPALLLAYLGQGARLIVDPTNTLSNVFYNSIPLKTGGGLWYTVWLFGILATIVASQAMITASFSLIQQMVGSGSFPTVAIRHTSDSHRGQIYAPVPNLLLLVGCVGVVVGFGTDSRLTNAYGFAISFLLFLTTMLLTLVMINVRAIPAVVAVAFLLFFGFIDGLFFSSSVQKIPQGAYVTLTLAVALALFLCFWTWARHKEDVFDAAHRLRLNEIFTRSNAFEPGTSEEEKTGATTAFSIEPIDERADHEIDELARTTSNVSEQKVKIARIAEKDTSIGELMLIAPDGPIKLPRMECFSFFHHLGEGVGAPHSFSSQLRHMPVLPRVCVFLAIKTVNVPHLQEEDKYMVDKLRAIDGLYVMRYRLGYRDKVDLRNMVQPVLQRIVDMERGGRLPGTAAEIDAKVALIEAAARTPTHFLPSYHVTSKGNDIKMVWLRKPLDAIRAFLLEECYRRVAQNFPPTAGYIVDESQILRIGVNASI
ncbi:uncharacterized protein L969DRAFT_341840 [Mixia osmundae IAM 14324]|uniref:Potassium transporter n=1 Tax=Mixia osmundae (strain CBS 9802 / IAM 14324 / JCM 22182 / KY 12970) TaxID=764103 RepID=G7E612_MIXOS|nr:uncharacterized protein L969DRAFT_341840 [Mixia osmundae IAM 14324]KEI40579.1 hypothetical protein L969DRAFT_341840 [Mixia osmundae IAM 14324]GAA98272.1 hypothetical protein E5Q_04955 [Mixia osmundae IAM 14324]